MNFLAPPMFPTDYLPKEIVGDRNLDTFRKHYKICSSGKKQGEFPDKELDKVVGQSARQAIGETIGHLINNGFYPIEITQDGRVKVGVQTKGAVQIMMEKGLRQYEEMPEEQLMRIARSGYRPLLESVKIGRPSRDEMDFQRIDNT